MPTKQELLAKLLDAMFGASGADMIAWVLSGFGTIATALASAALKVFHSMSRSVGQLNANIEIVIKRTDAHAETLVDHEARLRIGEEIRKPHNEGLLS